MGSVRGFSFLLLFFLGALNLAAALLVRLYTGLALVPALPPREAVGGWAVRLPLLLLLFGAILAGLSLYLKPIRRWAAAGAPSPAPPQVRLRAARLPLGVASLCMAGWAVGALFVLARAFVIFEPLPPSTYFHILARPLVVGSVVSVGAFFGSELLARRFLWPRLFPEGGLREVAGRARLGVGARLLLLSYTISFLPLLIIGLQAHSVAVEMGPWGGELYELAHVIAYLGTVALALGVALSLAVTRSIAGPLRELEQAMEVAQEGSFPAPVAVASADEVGSLQEGFNRMVARLERAYRELEERNRELAAALERISLLEKVKASLDKFVPDSARRRIEANPEEPGLTKQARDVSVLFLDIEGYTCLSEWVSREELTYLVERYFGSYLEAIRVRGGEINETAGDGLMILFQDPELGAHARAAVECALAIREKTQQVNRVEEGRHFPVTVNIGINSGLADVGLTRFAGPAGERWTYTATGPTTNLAARLGEEARRGAILIGPETERRVRGEFLLEPKGSLSLRNVQEPVPAFEVLGAREAALAGRPEGG